MKPLTRADTARSRCSVPLPLRMRWSGAYQRVVAESTVEENGPPGSANIVSGMRCPLGETRFSLVSKDSESATLGEAWWPCPTSRWALSGGAAPPERGAPLRAHNISPERQGWR